MLRLPQKLTLQHHQIMRLPREVTLQHDRILRLPRKVTVDAVTSDQKLRSQATKNCGHKRPPAPELMDDGYFKQKQNGWKQPSQRTKHACLPFSRTYSQYCTSYFCKYQFMNDVKLNNTSASTPNRHINISPKNPNFSA